MKNLLYKKKLRKLQNFFYYKLFTIIYFILVKSKNLVYTMCSLNFLLFSLIYFIVEF